MAALLLDTHAFLWWVTNDKALPPRARRMIEDDTNTIQLSHASVWEMSIKAGLGKLSLSTPVLDFVQDECRKNRIQLLPISLSAIGRVERLRRHHGDPFDRLLAAECLVREEPIISADKIFGKYSVKRIWR